ncbi:MAG TPA: isochorismatase family protein [Xanthobacteraceae bacterium]|jgi:nicotinamidase-related amidase|nr:isochorismatase family protein [Xanthobacteraceae bacterium]
MSTSRFAAAMGGALLIAAMASPTSADIISDWTTAVAPPPPELKEVTVDPSTTALLFLDIMKTGCSARPRCVAAVPNMIRLHDAARAHNMVVWYSLVGSNGKATPDDIMDPKLKPRAGEWYRQGGPDKFLGSTLEPTLKQAGIKTVIVCGNSFQGATVGTASGAAQRGYKVIVPVDCSAGEDAYHEQYAAFHLAAGGPVIVTSNVTMTRSTMIKF